MSTRRVTWLLPVKNGMPYIRETLASIESQTYKELQILALDNGSTDGTLEELLNWIPSRIPGRVITDVSCGVGGALGRLVCEADTDICARIDADDVNLPNRLRLQVEYLLINQNVAAVGCGMLVIDKLGNETGQVLSYPTENKDIINTLMVRNCMPHPGMCFRRSAIINVGNYSDLKNIEDYDLWLRVAQRYKLGNLPEYLVKYRIHANSETQIAIRDSRLQALLYSTVSKHSPDLYGIEVEAFSKLLEKRTFFPIWALLKIPFHYKKKFEWSFFQTLTSRSFLDSFNSFVNPKDIPTRIIIAGLHRSFPEISKEVKSIAVSILNRVFHAHKFLMALKNYIRKLRNYFKIKKWINGNRACGTIIHRSVYFANLSSPAFDNICIGPNGYLDRDFTLWISRDIGADPSLKIGGNFYCGRNVYIGVYKPIVIEDDVIIGAYSYIISANHKFDDRDVPIRSQGFEGEEIHIRKGAWIGTHVVVLPGVQIGEGSVIAAHSLVNSDVPEFEVWGGVPAKFIKTRH